MDNIENDDDLSMYNEVKKEYELNQSIDLNDDELKEEYIVIPAASNGSDSNSKKDSMDLVRDFDDDEKGILLGITPGNFVEEDPWKNWQPQTAEEKDVQFEIAAALMDKKNIDITKAMEKARQKMVEMKRNNEPISVPANLSQRRASEIQNFGPSARKKTKNKETIDILMEFNDEIEKEMKMEQNVDDESYRIQSMIMQQIKNEKEKEKENENDEEDEVLINVETEK